MSHNSRNTSCLANSPSELVLDPEDRHCTCDPVQWLSDPPSLCDVCHAPIINTFVDGVTLGGPWGCLCLNCHRDIGRGFGTGLGQRFEKMADGRWIKTRG